MEGGFPSRLPSLSYVSDGANANDDPNNISNQRPPVREHDQYMPIANIIRIMRRVLPTYAKISDDAKETIQECVSEYISFITSEANERCQREHRKTVTAEDLLWAMGKLGFDDYVEPLSSYINRYRELETGRNPLKSEDYGKRKMDYDPPLGVPLYGPNFNYGPQPGMFDVMDMGQTIDGPINGPINGPFNGDFGGQMVDPMGGPMVGAMGGYYGESSGAGDPSTHPPGPYDFNPYAQFK